MTVLQAILIAILYYVANSPWPFGGLGNYATIYRPMVSGLVVGIILGDPVTGTIVGATINLMYIGFISAGGSMPADMSLAGILGTAIAITSGIDAEAAVAFAVPLGLLGALVWVGRLTLDSFFVRVADKYVEEGKPEKVWIANILLPQVLLFFMTFIPCFLAALYGTAYVKGFIDSLSGKFLGILSTIGGMLPAVGIGMMLLAIYKGRARIFFFLGFFAAAKKQGMKVMKKRRTCGSRMLAIQTFSGFPSSTYLSATRTKNESSVRRPTQTRAPNSPRGTANATAASASIPLVIAIAVPRIPARDISAGIDPPALMNPMYMRLMVAPTIVPVTGSPSIIPTTRPDTIGL
jgi:PTS system mannose-specific IIC component